MIVLDTCVLIFDALTPERLTARAKKAIDHAQRENSLFCADISLWEVAMLIQKKRLYPGIETEIFLEILISARQIQILPINIKIASFSSISGNFKHHDPADRLIAATAIHYHSKLVTSDKKLADIPKLEIIW